MLVSKESQNDCQFKIFPSNVGNVDFKMEVCDSYSNWKKYSNLQFARHVVLLVFCKHQSCHLKVPIMHQMGRKGAVTQQKLAAA